MQTQPGWCGRWGCCSVLAVLRAAHISYVFPGVYWSHSSSFGITAPSGRMTVGASLLPSLPPSSPAVLSGPGSVFLGCSTCSEGLLLLWYSEPVPLLPWSEPLSCPSVQPAPATGRISWHQPCHEGALVPVMGPPFLLHLVSAPQGVHLTPCLWVWVSDSTQLRRKLYLSPKGNWRKGRGGITQQSKLNRKDKNNKNTTDKYPLMKLA